MGNFIKIIYFDESTVTDLIQIVNGGNMKTTTDFITDIESELKGNAEVGVSVDTNQSKGISKVFSFLSGINVEASADAGGNISRKKDKVVKNILENTILTDFLQMLKKDGKRKNQKFSAIKEFENLELYPGENSFSYIMLVAPYMNMIDGKMQLDGKERLQVDLSKVEETMEHGRGYYEFIGKQADKPIVFRFNYKAFRNGYTMSDLTKMQLSLYSIKVGKTTFEKLDISTEFEFGTKKKQRIEYDAALSNNDAVTQEIDVYDVLLAGIKG